MNIRFAFKNSNGFVLTMLIGLSLYTEFKIRNLKTQQ